MIRIIGILGGVFLVVKGLILLYHGLIGNIPGAEPKLLILIAIATVCYGIGGWAWWRDST